jgi:hypothetical protein
MKTGREEASPFPPFLPSSGNQSWELETCYHHHRVSTAWRSTADVWQPADAGRSVCAGFCGVTAPTVADSSSSASNHWPWTWKKYAVALVYGISMAQAQCLQFPSSARDSHLSITVTNAFFFFCSTGHGAQGLAHISQALYHWGTSPTWLLVTVTKYMR